MSGRVGVLGGTFDPPHNGHVRMAVAALDELGLDQVFLAPATSPPHKSNDDLTPYLHRLAMTERAAEGIDRVSVSQIEEEGEGPSFTINLIHKLRDRGFDDIYFIIGSDSLRELSTWKDPQKVLEMCTVVVFLRGDTLAQLGVEGPADVIVFETPRIDVSSTQLRACVHDGDVDDAMIPAGVLDYISEHQLYLKR